MLIIVDDSLLQESVFERLQDAVDRDLAIVLGGQTTAITTELGAELPNVRTFETGLEWLTASGDDHEVAISRIVLVDREALLIGSYYPDDDENEQAIHAAGLDNGAVVLLRRLISTGLADIPDPQP